MAEITELLGAGFVGGIASFVANIGKEYFMRKKENARVYDNFKMNLFGELHSLRYELSDAIKERDFAHIEYVDIFYNNLAKKVDRSEGSEFSIAEKKLEAEEKKVRELEIKFFKHLSLYLYKKKYKTEVAELERQFKTEGLKYDPPIYNGNQEDRVEFITFYRNRDKLYTSFHTTKIGIPLAQMIRCVMDDK